MVKSSGCVVISVWRRTGSTLTNDLDSAADDVIPVGVTLDFFHLKRLDGDR
jgi:hypothetical protein